MIWCGHVSSFSPTLCFLILSLSQIHFKVRRNWTQMKEKCGVWGADSFTSLPCERSQPQFVYVTQYNVSGWNFSKSIILNGVQRTPQFSDFLWNNSRTATPMKIILFLRVRMTEKERNFGNGVVDYSIGTIVRRNIPGGSFNCKYASHELFHKMRLIVKQFDPLLKLFVKLNLTKPSSLYHTMPHRTPW